MTPFGEMDAKICRQWCVESVFDTLAKQLSEMTIHDVANKMSDIETMTDQLFNYIESGNMNPPKPVSSVRTLKAVE